MGDQAYVSMLDFDEDPGRALAGILTHCINQVFFIYFKCPFQ